MIDSKATRKALQDTERSLHRVLVVLVPVAVACILQAGMCLFVLPTLLGNINEYSTPPPLSRWIVDHSITLAIFGGVVFLVSAIAMLLAQSSKKRLLVCIFATVILLLLAIAPIIIVMITNTVDTWYQLKQDFEV